jgi:outer membrane beta-barrel protein
VKRGAAALLVLAAASAAAPIARAADDEMPAACIDEDVKADLFAKRKQRTSRERLFQQTNRHELTLQGGYYTSDLFDGVGVVHVGTKYLHYVPLPGTFGFAYAYHMTEDLAVEASASYTRISSLASPELERNFKVLEDRPRRELMFEADLIWSIAHAKMRLGGAIDHFDLYLAGGAGVVDSVVSSQIAANAGFGLKFFMGRMWAIRFDVRDHIFRQQLLAETLWVNDLTTTIGLSIYLPTRE